MDHISVVILMIALHATDCFVTHTIWRPVAHLRRSHYYYGFDIVSNQTNLFAENTEKMKGRKRYGKNNRKNTRSKFYPRDLLRKKNPIWN